MRGTSGTASRRRCRCCRWRFFTIGNLGQVRVSYLDAPEHSPLKHVGFRRSVLGRHPATGREAGRHAGRDEGLGRAGRESRRGGRPFHGLVAGLGLPKARADVAALLVGALMMAYSGWFASRKRERLGRHLLLGIDAVVILAMLAVRLIQAESHQPVWPVLLAGLAFFYLWWLGILLFDLAFIWHRYIRNSVAIRTLAEWSRGRDAQPIVTLRWPRRQPPGAAR